MKKNLIASSLLALLVAGCATAPEPQADAAPAAAQTGLSAEASAALAQARADVKEAKTKEALWTTAADALEDAEKAAEKGDSATVMKASARASDQAKLGLAQLSYPPMTYGDN